MTQQVVLHDLSWDTYQAMLRDLGDERAARLAYDRGTLEITMPSDSHEIVKHLLERIVTALTVEFGLPIKGAGSVTLSRADLRQSVEPDACYYIRNASRVRGRHLDLATDPPPDLAIEVDVTSASGRKLAIYARLGVPELWVYANGRVTIHELQGEAYGQREESPTFPGVTATLITAWLEQGETEDDNSVVRQLRRWVREQGQRLP
jgi:Uma2 family endonuclease